ncbi:MAG: hypothetical protein ABIA04_05090 [Pseudomonadota bacterium]
MKNELLFISILALSIIFVFGYALSSDDDKYEYSESMSIDAKNLDKIETFSIDGSSGEFNIKTWDKKYIEIKLVKKSETEEGLKKIKISSEAKKDKFKLKIDIDTSLKKSLNQHVEINAMVPKNIKLEINATAGSIKIEDFEANFNIDLNAGSVKFKNLKLAKEGTDVIDLDAGEVKIDFNKDLPPFKLDAKATVGGIKTGPGFAVEETRAHLIGGQLKFSYNDGTKKLKINVGAGGIKLDKA